MYKIDFTEKAKEDLAKLKKNEPNTFRKASKLLVEISEHPETGTGQPEQMKYNLSGCWSRRITGKHRIIYRILDEVVIVVILSSYGHYEDK
jgi:toxin YoeB